MRPTQRLFWFAIGWTLLGFAAALNNWLPPAWNFPDWQPQIEKIWQVTSATLVLLTLMDLIMVRRSPLPTIRRAHSESLALGPAPWAKLCHWRELRAMPTA